jgi:hypothetical protein
VERIRRILPEITQFAAPERVALIDFWSDEQGNERRQNSHSRRDNGSLLEMGSVIASVREGVEHHQIECTEDQIFNLPKLLLENDYDGVVILPPMGPHRETRETLSSLMLRHQVVRQRGSAIPALFALTDDDPNDSESLDEFWSSIPRNVLRQRDLSAFVISLILSAVSDGTSITAISPISLLSGGATARLRESISKGASLRLIMEGGGNWPGLHNQIQLAVVCLEAGRQQENMVRLFKCPDERNIDLDEVVTDLQRLFRQQGGQTRHGFVMRSGMPASGNWLVESHHPRWEQYISELRELGEVTTLSSLGEFTRPVMLRPSEWATSPTGWPALHARQVSTHGTIEFDDVDERRYWNEEPQADLKLLPGDVVIREIRGMAGQVTPLRLARLPRTEEAWFLGSALIRFRFNEDVDEGIRKYVLAYLQSQEAAQWLSGQNAGPRVFTRELESLPIPVPEESVLAAFSRLSRTHRQFSDWAQQLQDVQSRLFSFATLREARDELLVVSARAEQRIVAAEATDTLSWRIRNLYPHPLAFRWRTIEIQESGVEKYLEILRVSEVCMAYAAIFSIALIEVLGGDYETRSIKEIISSLSARPGTGVTFWSWVSIVEEVNESRTFRDIGPGTPFIEVSKMYESNSELKDVIKSLMEKRNDFSHDRGPTESELAEGLNVLESELETVYESLDFLTRYPLRDIDSVRMRGRNADRGTYSCRELMGDHPVPTPKSIEFSGSAPAQGLHLIDQSEKPHFIEPWLIRRPCAKCKHEESYILDRYERNGQILFKSLEYGHELDASDLREELREVGAELPEIG